MASSRVCVQALWLDFQGVALQRDFTSQFRNELLTSQRPISKARVLTV